MKRRGQLEVLHELEKIAARLDAAGRYDDADAIDKAMIRLADSSTPVTHTDSTGKVWTQVGIVDQQGMGGMKGTFVEWKDDRGNRSRFLKGTLPGPTTGKLEVKKPHQPGMLERGMNFINNEVENTKHMFSDKPLHEKVNQQGVQESQEWMNKITQ
jgi:hypothetical protein